MGILGGYYVIIPALFWFIIIVTALAFLVGGVAAGYVMGRQAVIRDEYAHGRF